MQPILESDDETETGEFLAFDELVGRFYELEPRGEVAVEFGGLTDRGRVRPNNEDNFLIVRRRRLREVVLSSLGEGDLKHPEQVAYTLAVADGMGGREFGELASLLALRTGWALGGDEVKWALKMNDREVQEVFSKATIFYKLVHRSLIEAMREEPRLAGMGTTLTICYTAGRELFVLHAGDSRAYLHRRGELTRLTRDHTRAQLLLDAGVIEPGSPEERRHKHVLTNCLGGPYQDVAVDVDHHRLRDGDRLMLCTDGLTDLVEDAEIARILDEHPAPQDACQSLINLANDRGGRDNITAVVARYSFPAPTPAPARDPSPDGQAA